MINAYWDPLTFTIQEGTPTEWKRVVDTYVERRLLGPRFGEIRQIAAGFGLMGAGLGLMVIARTTSLIFTLVGRVALEMALVSPNVAALISRRGGNHRVGEAVGAQNAANSLAQASGPVLGGALFVSWMSAPHLLTGALSAGVALVLGWSVRKGRQPTRYAS